MKSNTVTTTVAADREKVWKYWTTSLHIEKWNAASADWECPHAENDLRPKGIFLFRMSAKDGSVGFDFKGVYTQVIEFEKIAYTIDDGREVTVQFTLTEDGVRIEETFELETENGEELQRAGWQAILNRFKQYVEASSGVLS